VPDIFRFSEASPRQRFADFLECLFRKRGSLIRCVDPTRFNCVDVDAMGKEFDGNGLGEVIQRRFGCTIGGAALEWHFGLNAADKNDFPSAAVISHVTGDGLAEVKS